MAKEKQPQRPKVDPLAAEIDALLKKLPHADPGLKGDEPARSPMPASTSPRPSTRPRRGGDGPPPLDKPTRMAVWGRVLLGTVFGVALTQWPYGSDCGWSLLGYGVTVLLLLVVGAWGALASWRGRIGAAHLLALSVVGLGLVLAADVMLPRIGYAADAATWRCHAAAPAASVPSTNVAPPAAPIQPDVADQVPERRTPPAFDAAVPDSVHSAPDGVDSQVPPDSNRADSVAAQRSRSF